MLRSNIFLAWVFLLCVGCADARATHSMNHSVIPDVAVTPLKMLKPVAVTAELQNDRTASLIGTWEASKLGHQTLTNRPDGTATIDMSLTPLAAALYGRRVTLDLKWTLDGDYLTQTIVGGSPARSVDKLVRKYGDTFKYKLLDRNAGQLLVADVSGSSEPVRWTAVKSYGR